MPGVIVEYDATQQFYRIYNQSNKINIGSQSQALKIDPKKK